MGPLVLCEQQIRKTLSAKNALKKVSKSRNVLAWPKRFDSYRDNWPVLDEQTDDELKTLLGNLLPPAKLPSRSLPLAVVKKVKGEERKELRICLQASGATDLRGGLLPGLNCVLRAVAKGDAAAVLVADSAPRCLAELTLRACRRANVPVVVMPTLDAATRRALGFGCLALGLRRVGDQSNASVDVEHFAPLRDRLAALAAASPCQRDDEGSDDAPLPAVEIPMKREPANDVRLSAESVYKQRASRLHRAFRPPQSNLVAIKTEAKARVEVQTKTKVDAQAGVKTEVKGEVNAGVKPEVEVYAGVKPKVKGEPGLGFVDVKGSLKRNADFLQQDFIPFGDWPVASQSEAPVRPVAKPKAASPTPSTVAAATGKPRLPTYRPLVVKSIQPNPAKKKKGKKAKATG